MIHFLLSLLSLLCAFGATVIVNGGQAIVTNLVSGLGGTVPKFIGWGTGVGTAAVTDTGLFTEADSRATGTVTRVTTTVTNDTMQVVGTMTAGSGETITNVGLFDASSSGNMYMHADHSSFLLGAGETITYTIKIKFA